MNLNDIHLPVTAIADLYKSVLIADSETVAPEKIKEIKVSEETNPTSAINFLGNNKKQIAILVNYMNAVYLPDENLAFLTSILTACKLNLDDIAVVNFVETDKISYKDFLKEIPAKSIILFGVLPDKLSLPLNFPDFQVQHFDGVNYLTSPQLDDIEKNKVLKGNLWNSLKKLFNL